MNVLNESELSYCCSKDHDMNRHKESESKHVPIWMNMQTPKPVYDPNSNISRISNIRSMADHIKFPVFYDQTRQRRIQSVDDRIIDIKKEIQILNDQEESVKICCCFSRNRSWKLYCCVLLAIILISTALFFIWPR
jgi:hypothetical protein